MRELIGKKIESLAIEKSGEHYLLFRTDQGPVCYQAEGDCCSESWFADITGLNALIGHTVRGAEAIDERKAEDDRTRQEYDIVYGYKITTTGGYADVVFRNSSNGYYYGWLELCDRVPPEVEFKEVTDDFGA